MFDYIIVGGGSAGCALAARLSDDPNVNVLMLEAGKDKNDLRVDLPVLMSALYESSAFNWNFWSQPEQHVNKQPIYCPRGKGVGGSSLINAMLYVRGPAYDYDSWQQDGWRYSDVLPYFKRAEDNKNGEDDYHGVGGPLSVEDPIFTHSHAERMVYAAMQAGYAYNPDFNGETQEGVGLYQVTMRDGIRCSAKSAYIEPNRSRANLRIIDEAHVNRIIFEGKKAVGVEYRRKGLVHELRVNREVILSAGALQSPQLLMLSGVGDKARLESLGIDVVHHLPGVGQNLQEHADVVVAVESKKHDTLALSAREIVSKGFGLLKHFVGKKGTANSPIVESGGFIKLDPASPEAEIQIHTSPILFDDHGMNKQIARGYGYSMHVTLMRPDSRGQVTLNSADPEDAPKIELNMLAEQSDVDTMIKGVRVVRDILKQDAYRLHHKKEVIPGEEVQSDDQLEQFVREKTRHVYHPVGTCKMGNDEMAVVDAELKVHGLDGLRVVDVSIMPTIIGGNTNAPAMMIGERAADLILGASGSADQGEVESTEESESLPA